MNSCVLQPAKGFTQVLASLNWLKQLSGLGDLFFTFAVVWAVYVICRRLLRVDARLAELELKTGWIRAKRTGDHQITVEANLVGTRLSTKDDEKDEVRNAN